MLSEINLARSVDRTEYKEKKDVLELKLAALQRQAKELGIPVFIVFEGWGAAGKGTLINNLILPLDPRGFKVYSTLAPTEEETHYPFLWRFWQRTPPKGRFCIFDRSWYRSVLHDRVSGNLNEKQVVQAFQDIGSFERQLTDDGALIIKFFLHISKKVQKSRFEKLEKSPSTAWRVTKDDWKRHKAYADFLKVTDEMLAETDSDFSPWTVVEAHEKRFATLKIFSTVTTALENHIRLSSKPKTVSSKLQPALSTDLGASILGSADLSQSLKRAHYKKMLKEKQTRFRQLEHEIYMQRIPVVIVYEGWDAAGKGGNIRRLTQNLDPRGYEVIPIAAPNDSEKDHHYLWRFWTQMPKAGHISIFDRSWYGRVLVERVEGFCSEPEWRRAYREINEMEKHLTHFGAVVVKFWVHIDKDEQLRRFEEREKTAHKKWKITEEDWRNRERWDDYKLAVEEMVSRTSVPHAPWTVIESNCKLFARIKALDTVITAIENRLRSAKKD